MPKKRKQRQSPMFGEGQDFPLFSQTAPRAQAEPFVPKESPRQGYLPGMELKWSELAQARQHRPGEETPEPGESDQLSLL